MKKVIKIGTIILLIAGLFIGSSMLLLARLVQPEIFKDQLVKAVALQTGRQIAIRGKIGVASFPAFSAVLRDVTISNSKNFADKPFAHANKIEARVEILPLFLGKVQISKFVFQDFTINLERKESGLNNWDDLLSESSNDNETTKALPTLYMSNVNFENVNINFDDYQYARHLQIKDLDLVANGINLHGNAFFVHAKGFIVSDNPEISSQWRYDGKLSIDPKNEIYSMKNSVFAGTLYDDDFPKELNYSVGMDCVVDIHKQDISVDKIHLQLENATADAKIRATNIIFAPNVVGDIKINNFDANHLLRSLGLKAPMQAGKDTSIWKNVSLQATIQTTAKFLKIPNITLHVDDATLNGSGSYSHFNDKLIVFDFDVDNLDLDRYVQAKQATPNDVANNIANTQQDDTKFSYKLWNHRHRHTVFNIKTDRNGSANKTNNSNSLMDIFSEILHEMVINGDLRIRDLKFEKLHMHDISLQVGGDAGEIDLNPFECKFYQGSISGSLNINLHKKIPAFALAVDTYKVNVRDLLKDTINNTKLSGMANAKIKLNTTGNTWENVVKNLRGLVSGQIINGVFYGSDFRYEVEKVIALINGRKPKLQESNPPTSIFTELSGKFDIAQGIATTKNLLLQSPYVKVTGKGKIDFVKNALNVQLNAYHNDNKDFYIPIKVGGTFSEPEIAPDVTVFVNKLLQNAFVHNKDKI